MRNNKRKQSSLNRLPIPTRSSKLSGARRRMVLLLLAMALLLAGYGGDGGGSPPDGHPPLEGNPPPSNNQPPVAVAGCSNTPQDTVLTGFLQATDRDNNSNELTFSLNPNVPNVSGPIWTAKGSIQLLDTTTGEFSYTPSQLGARGVDTFQFRMDDPDSFAMGTETVIINQAIMPLGDSITQGAFGNNQPPLGERVGYRRKLYDDLIVNGFHVDFVGILRNGLTANPPIADPDHEGHAGFTTSQIAQNVRFWLTGNLADIVLLSVGKNNINFDNPADTLAQTNQILDNIDGWQSEKNP
jgi:Bacterial Ig domain